MTAADIAYLASLVEKSPSSYPSRKELLEELQQIYRDTQEGLYGPTMRVPIMATLKIDRG